MRGGSEVKQEVKALRSHPGPSLHSADEQHSLWDNCAPSLSLPAMAQQTQAGDPASSNAAAGRRKTKHEKSLAELAFSNPGVKAAGAAVAQSPPLSSAGSASSWLTRARKASETGSDTSHED